MYQDLRLKQAEDNGFQMGYRMREQMINAAIKKALDKTKGIGPQRSEEFMQNLNQILRGE